MPLIPLYDTNPRLYVRAHFVTIALIVVNTLIFVHQIGIEDADRFGAVVGYAVLPARFFDGLEVPTEIGSVSAILTLITHQFLHADWTHIAFNMLFLWVFGDNIEDALGHVRFILFFLLCGVVGGLLHSFIEPDSMTPVIGASGAISGVLGGYLILYPRARVLVLAFMMIPLRLPALLVIGTFFAQDLLWGLTDAPAALGVAVWAHIGGFIAGAVLVVFLRNPCVTLWSKPSSPR
ncbi:MAG TPA: rhomboid family intramembrane serine protease [Rhodospirillaceae bacterium]|nr:rhomboid family intramembrane serine protease [Rhodospirillaceae bacterium]